MKKTTLPFFYIFLISFVYSHATQADCTDSSRSTEEINVCQYSLAKNLEYKLKKLEKKIIFNFDSEQQSRFEQAQTAWRKMVAVDCEIESAFYEGAPIYTAIVSQCLQKHYLSRIEQIKNYICPDHSLNTSCKQSELIEQEIFN